MKRSPRIPRFGRQVVVDHDRRYRSLAAANVSERHSALVRGLDANPRQMLLMLLAAQSVSVRATGNGDPWSRLRHALADFRAMLDEETDVQEVQKFDAWFAAQNWVTDTPDPYDEMHERASALTADQYFVWLASSFAHNDWICEFMGTDENALAKRQARLRKDGLSGDDAAANLIDLVEDALRMSGLATEVEELRSAFDRVDVQDEEALAEVANEYENALFALMHDEFSNE